MFNFNEWENVEIIPTKKVSALDHMISVRKQVKGGGYDFVLSADLAKETDTTVFKLQRKNNIFALVPVDNGPLTLNKNHRVIGLTAETVKGILTGLGLPIDEKRTRHINTIVINGAVIFPKERVINI